MRKKSSAALRTIGLFSGRTPIEEAEGLLDAEERDREAPETRDIVAEGEEDAIRWLGLDAFHTGDDVKVMLSKKTGNAVVMLVDTTKKGVPYGVRQFRMSLAQWTKLKKLVKDPTPQDP